MGDWYNAKIKYTQVTEDDKVKTISESYLFDALSYTEAEARTYEYMASNLPDFELVDIKKMRLNEVFFIEDGGEYWFKCRVQYITFDEKTKAEKKTAVPMLINAEDLKLAYESLYEKLGKVEDFIISDINVTKIVEVIPYDKLIDQRITDGRLKPMLGVIPASKVEEKAILQDVVIPEDDEEEVVSEVVIPDDEDDDIEEEENTTLEDVVIQDEDEDSDELDDDEDDEDEDENEDDEK
ncbi:protein of unknown function [Spirosomataceae bacterium TFI 002]|nr:protein of unknown function [Spirosomataceae bacterium TFI 002]